MFIDQATHSGIGENEKEKEKEGEGESGSTVDRLVCLAADDSSVGDSASATSTKQLFATIFALMRGLRSHVPCFWSRKARSSKRRTAHWQSTKLPTDGHAAGRHCRHPRQHRSRCTRALMKTLGRSRWLRGLSLTLVSVTVDACIVAVRMELDLGPLSNHENLTQGGRGRLGIYG